MTRLTLLIALIVAWPGSATAQRVLHRVRFGETLASISDHYYGSKAYSQLLQLVNGLPAGARRGKLTAGTRLRVPTAWTYTAPRTTSLQNVAARYLGDRRRWPALAMLNNIRGRRRRVRKGTKLLIPFTLPYTVSGREEFADIAKRFLGSKKYGRLVASFNFIHAPRPAPGTQLELPLGAPQIQQAVLQRLTRQQVLGISTEVDRVERERLQEANALLRRGEYWEVPLRLLQLLARNHAEDTHVAEVFKLLAVAYVAVGQTELAVKSFREALLREPGLNLDVVTTSPKVMRAFVDAKSGQRQVTP